MARREIDVMLQRFPFYALQAMGNEDLVFGSDDTLDFLRRDPLRDKRSDGEYDCEDEDPRDD